MSTSTFSTSALQLAWSKRKNEIHLEDHASVLYDSLSDEIFSNLSRYYAALRSKCATARSVKELEIPIWEYNTRYILGESDDLSRNDTVIADGLHWMVGTVAKPANIEAGPLHLVPVHVVLRDTDILARLTVGMFDSKHYSLTVKYKSKYTDTILNIHVVTREIVLRFYPNGLSDQSQAYLNRLNISYPACRYPPWFTAGVVNGKERIADIPVTPDVSPVPKRGTKRALSFDDDEMPPLIPVSW